MNQHADDRAEALKERLRRSAHLYGVALAPEAIDDIARYYQLIMTWNPRLHLVADCSPSEFAERHILESLFALRWLSANSRVIDVGAGAGLPSIPCSLARSDLRLVLIEASAKKAVFLREAVRALGISDRAAIVNGRFETAEPPTADALLCRAIERFAEILPALYSWSVAVPRLLLFGGPSLGAALDALTVYEKFLLPNSEQRFLYVVRREAS